MSEARRIAIAAGLNKFDFERVNDVKDLDKIYALVKKIMETQ